MESYAVMAMTQRRTNEEVKRTGVKQVGCTVWCVLGRIRLVLKLDGRDGLGLVLSGPWVSDVSKMYAENDDQKSEVRRE